jgi:hypothetical protein
MATINLIDTVSGQVYSVDESQAQAAQAKFGLVPATDEQVKDYDYKKQATALDSVEAGARGLASTLIAPAAALAKSGLPAAIGAPVAPEMQGAADPFFERAAEVKRQHPLAFGVGAALPEVALGAVTGGASLVPTLAAEAVVGGLSSEATDAAVEGRAMTAEGVLKNGALSLGFGAIGHGLGAAYRALSGTTPLVESAQNAAKSRVNKALVDAGEDLGDPVVSAAARERISAETSDLLEQLDSAVSDYRYNVKGQRGPQRQALSEAAEALRAEAPDVAARLEEAAAPGLGQVQRFRILQELVSENPALEDIANNRALWGDAVDEANTIRAAQSARASSPADYAESLRSLKDDRIEARLADLDDSLESARTVDTAEAFGSVGARADREAYTLPDDQIAELLDDANVEDTWSKVALGAPGTGEKGAFERAFVGWKDSVNNAQKHADFYVNLPDDDVLRTALTAEREALANELEAAAQALKDMGATAAAKRISNQAEEVRGIMISKVPGAIDRAKQSLDDIHMTSWRTADKIQGDNLRNIVDPVVERARKTLEDPSLVGSRIAELQQGRNAAWSGENGFIRANQRLEANGVRFFKNIERDYHTGQMVIEPDVNGIRKLLALDEYEANQALPHLAVMTDAMDRMLENLIDSGVVKSASRRADVKATQAAIAEIRDLAGVVENRLLAKRMTSQGAGAAAGRAVDFATGLVPGKAGEALRASGAVQGIKARAQATAAKRYVPETGGQALSKLNKLLRKGAAPMAGVGALFAVSKDAEAAEALQVDSDEDTAATARALTDPEYAARYAKRSAGQPSTLDLFKGVYDDLAAAYQDHRARVEVMARDPEALIDSLAETFGDLPDGIRDEVGAKAFQVATYLQSQLPPVRGVSVTRPNGLPPSSLEMRSYGLKYMTATHPRTAFDDAKRGTLRHEQVDTLEACWPVLHEDLRTQTLLAMGNGKSTIQQRQRADLLFGFGSALDPAFSPRLSAAARTAEQARDQGAPGSAPTTTKIPQTTNPGGLNALSLGATAPQ